LATPGQLIPSLRKLGKNSMHNLDTHGSTADDDDNDKGHVDSIVCIAFFSDKEHLVTSGRDGRVILWNYEEDGKLTPLEMVPLDSPATDLWIKDGTYKLYAACAKGTCVVLDFSKHLTRKKDATTSSSTSNVPNPNKRILKKTATGNDDSDDDDDDDVDFGSESQTKSSTNRVRFVDDEACEDDADGEVTTPPSKENAMADTSVDEFADANAVPIATDMEDDIDEDEEPPSYLAPQRMLIPPQPAFSPSATPLDLARRFLCWNHIGSITILQGDSTQRNTVDISFTDSAFKRPISFTDNIDFILGSLGEDGGIFASDLQDDDDDDDPHIDGLDDLVMSDRTKQAVKRSHKKRQPDAKPTGSSIFYYRFETFGNLRHKDWYLTLPDGERVLGSACGEGWAAVMTR
jgi:chromosome transmission fidelity protein 4